MTGRSLLLLAVSLPVLLAAASAHSQVEFAELERMSADALNARLPRVSAADQGRIHAKLGAMAIDRDVAVSREHLRQAQQLLPADDQAAHSYVQGAWCWLHMFASDMVAARDACSRSIELAELVDDPWALTKAYYRQAAMLYQVGELRAAQVFGNLGSQAAERSAEPRLIANLRNTEGLIARANGQYQAALDHFTQGLDHLSQDNDEALYRIMSFNVGLAYADLGAHQQAKAFFTPTIEWARASGRTMREMTALVYMALQDIALGDAQQAIDSLTDALARPELGTNQGYTAFAYAVLGDAYIAQNSIQDALDAYTRGMNIAAQHPNTFEQRRLKTGYGRALLMAGRASEARLVVNEAIAQLRNEHSLHMLKQALELSSEIERAEGNHAAALNALREASTLSAQIQRSTLEQLAQLRTNFERNETQMQLAAVEQANIVRNGLILFCVALAFIGYLFASRRAERRRAEAQLEHAEILEALVTERTAELREKVAQAEVAEAARLALERQLNEAEKLRMLGQLTSGIAHDFNNLLTVINGATELIGKHVQDDERLSRLIQHILTAAASGSDITRALTTYARQQPLKLERVFVNGFLQDRVPILSRTMGSMVSLELEMNNCPDLYVVLDPAQLMTALLNLSLNARDAMSNRGVITVSLSVRDAKWAVIAVKDNGCGMTEEQITRAVEPFYTTKSESQGSGLGLSMVYGFSKQVGGELEIVSEPEVGTEVRMVLPLAHLADSRVTHIDFKAGK